MTALRCALMRGGTSKGAMFLADDLPDDAHERDELLLRVMGSPDPRQIDGLGGAHPLTSKVAIVSRSTAVDADLDYLFLQVAVDRPLVSDSQTCGNMLAAVVPFAIERGLIRGADPHTEAKVRLVNTSALATIRVRTAGGRVTYEGSTTISGVPVAAAPVEIEFNSAEAPLFPTGHAKEILADTEATCVDNGMPSVLVRAADLGFRGTEDPHVLEGNGQLREHVRAIRLDAMTAMGLSPKANTIPKIVLVSGPVDGGSINTRSFIPERVHQAIGVLGAASVAAAATVPDTVAHEFYLPHGNNTVRVEHPTGFLDIGIERDSLSPTVIKRSTVIRSARLIFDGHVHPVPKSTQPDRKET